MQEESRESKNERIERGAEREEALIWGSLPIMAIVGSIVFLALVFVPGFQPWVQFTLPIGIALLLLAVMLQLNRRRRGH